MKTNTKKILALIICFITIGLEILGFIIRPNRYDLPPIAFYTVISNYVALFASVVYIIGFFSKRFSKIVSVCRFTAANMLLVTFLIVFLVLIWFVTPYELLISENNSIHHIIAPVLTLCSYFFLEEHVQSKKAIIPFMTISSIYCVILVTLNCFNIVDGPYPFFMTNVFGLPLVIVFCILIAGAFYGISLLFLKWTKKYDLAHQ